MTDELTPSQRESLEALRATRGACPPPNALVAYEALNAADRERNVHHAHISICSRCQLALFHMAEPQLATGSLGSRWMYWALPVAAALALAVGLTLTDRRQPPPVQPDTIRGTELQIVAPAGAVEMIREFTWQSPIRAARYRVIVRRGSQTVWQTESTGLSAPAPLAGVIERDVQYEWQVEALDGEGNVRLASPPQSFLVY